MIFSDHFKAIKIFENLKLIIMAILSEILRTPSFLWYTVLMRLTNRILNKPGLSPEKAIRNYENLSLSTEGAKLFNEKKNRMISTTRQLPISISCSSFSLLRNLLFRFVHIHYVSKYQISDKNDSHYTESHSIIQSINIWTAAVSRPNLTTRGFREIETQLFKWSVYFSYNLL